MADADSIPGKAPAFQFYPNDFLADANVAVMSMQERGVYITLICYCWQQVTLPNNPDQLARLCGVPHATFRKIWPAIAPCFVFQANQTRLAHPRLEKERKKQRARRLAQSENGKLGGRPKNPPLSPVKPTPLPADKPKETPSSSVFSLRTSAPARKENASLSADDVIAERAARFLERYQDLYVKHRKGAHYLVRPHLDFPKAKELCAVWEDERLDKLATIFLLTDHEFAESGSRTIGQFAALASWCDGRLAEAGIA